MTAAELRALGPGRVRLVTSDGTFEGRLDLARLGPQSLVVLVYADDGDAPETATVIALDAVRDASLAEGSDRK